MPDDCPVDDEARRALRDLARRAEWRGQAGAAGAALDARTLREVGRQIEVALAREDDHEPWSYRASEQLAAYCQRAQPEWTPEQVAELSRLREEAVIALAPAPGESDVEPESKAGTRPRILTSVPRGSRYLAEHRTAAVALGLVSGLVVVALILLLPHFVGNNSNQTPVASATTSVPAAPTTTASTTAPTPIQSAAPTASATTSASTTAAPPSSAPATSPSASSVTSTSAGDGGGGSTSSVTAIQMTTQLLGESPPEVLVYGNITANGTGDIIVHVVISGPSGQQPEDEPIDDSGQTTYAYTENRPLSTWCGMGSVRITVSSGSVSHSATVPVSSC
jgi:hypothetical protein